MKITLQFSPAQIDAIAEVVAAKLAQRAPTRAAYTVAQAASEIGCSKETIRRRIRAGVLPTLPMSGRILRIPATAIHEGK